MHCFAYRAEVLVLCYAAERLPPRAPLHLDELEDLMEAALGYRGSRRVGDIRGMNLDMAYRQAKIALGLRHHLSAVCRADADRGAYLFGDALMYFPRTRPRRDERFMRFCFSHTVVEKIHAETSCQQHELPWPCSALPEQRLQRHRRGLAELHLPHRNTVLTIEKIQRRFDFDLALPRRPPRAHTFWTSPSRPSSSPRAAIP